MALSEEDQASEDQATIEAQKVWVMDDVAFGRKLKSIRIDEGFDRAEDLAEAVYRTTRIEIKKHTMWAIERGSQPPTVEQLIALVVTLKLHGQLLAFQSALRGDIAEKLARL